MFNNREIAFLICIIVTCLLKPFRNLTKSAINALIACSKGQYFKKPIVMTTIYFLFVALLIIGFLNKIELWKWIYLKEMIFWLVTDGITFLLLIKLEMKCDYTFFAKMFTGNFALVVILHFLLNLYTFSLLKEIVIVSVYFFLFIELWGCKNNPKSKKAFIFFSFLLSIYGIIGLAYFIINAVTDISKLLTFDNLVALLTPIVLSVFYIPFVYYFAIRFFYFTLFDRLKNNDKAGPKAKWKCRYLILKITKLRIVELGTFNWEVGKKISELETEEDLAEIGVLLERRMDAYKKKKSGG